MLLRKCIYEFRTPIVLVQFCKSHLKEEYDVRKLYGVLMTLFEVIFIRMS